MNLKLLLTFTLFLLTAFTAFNQSNSDDPSFFISNHNTPLHSASIVKTIFSGQIEINGEILLCDSTSTTLSVNGACNYNWYSDSMGNNIIGSDTDLDVTGIMSDTIIYFDALVTDTSISMPLPPHNNSFVGNTRGYWFQSPSTIQITGLSVPIEAGTGPSSIAVVRFNTSAPPEYSTTTNDFTLLGLWQNFTEDTLNVCIPINAGDYIGVLGVRAGANSYASSGAFNSTINGNTVTLTRMGMQFDLSTTSPQELWTEPNGSISRVDFIYGDTLIPSENIIAVNIDVPTPDYTTTDLFICNGDSVLFNGVYYTNTITLIDSVTNVSGCDSVVTTNLIQFPIFSGTENLNICAFDSLNINGAYIYTAGTYYDTLQNFNGCDSIVTYIVSSNATPTISVSNETLTTTVSGAIYQWLDCDNNYAEINGATSSSFTAVNNGSYAVAVTENGCTDTSACIIINSTGINANGLIETFTFYPNPTNSELTLEINAPVDPYLIQIYNTDGKIIYSSIGTLSKKSVDVSAFSSGVYYMHVINDNLNQKIKFIRK